MSNATVDALGMCFSHIPLLVWLIASSDKSWLSRKVLGIFFSFIDFCIFAL